MDNENSPPMYGVQNAPVLEQNEIDALLSFAGEQRGAGRPGMQKVLNSGLVAHDRLPMLEIVFDRFVRIMTTSLRNFTNNNVDVTIENISSMRFSEYMNTVKQPSLFAVVKAQELDNQVLMVVDGAMTYSIVDVLLGGHPSGSTVPTDGRSYTTIECSLVELLIDVVLEDLAASFEPVCPVTFRFERLEVNPRFAAIARASNAVIVAQMRVDMEGCGGRMELMIPFATLEPIRETLLQQFMGEKFGRDPIWENHLSDALWGTEVELDAVLDEQVMHLSEVMALRPGSRLILNVGPTAPVQLRCGEVALFECHVGQRRNHVAVRVDRLLRNFSPAD